MAPVLALLMAAAQIPDLAQLERMTARLAPTELRVDLAGLSAGDRSAVEKLIEASRLIDDIYLTQVWSGNRAAYAGLRQDNSSLGKARLRYFWINKSPWSALDAQAAFLPGVPARKPLGANFYPEDMTREAFEAWAKTLAPAARREALGFFTVIRRNPGGALAAVPYSREYRGPLERASALLWQASTLTSNASLSRFLALRAEAFLSNDYYSSDLAWMDLDAPLDITIGPYETYTDELFGYKAAFEAYVHLRDDRETARVAGFSAHLQEIENNLPIEARYRNRKLGGLAPIRVVNEIFASGDGNHGVQTAAYNLPNDERIVAEKGSKQILIKNVQEAKFRSTLIPIAARVLPGPARYDISFDAFFTHVLAHELSHGIGPHQIEVGGRRTTPRQELKEFYATLEEAKADVTGLFMLQYLYDHKLAQGNTRQLYTTYLASTFRSVRFGLTEAHGKGAALQFNYLTEKGGFVPQPDGTYTVDFTRIQGAVRDLARELLTIEARGDYEAARALAGRLVAVRLGMQKTIEKLEELPVDIEPVFVSAGANKP